MKLRDRLIRAEFFTCGDLLKLPKPVRDFYRDSWSIAEDSGCFVNDPFEIKITLYPSPYDAEISPEKITAWIAELVKIEKLVAYRVNGKEYLWIKSFHQHQKLHDCVGPELPLPEGLEFKAYSSTPHRGKFEPKVTSVSSELTPVSSELTPNRNKTNRTEIKRTELKTPDNLKETDKRPLGSQDSSGEAGEGEVGEVFLKRVLELSELAEIKPPVLSGNFLKRLELEFGREKVKLYYQALPFFSGVKNPGSFLKSALREDYCLPPLPEPAYQLCPECGRPVKVLPFKDWAKGSFTPPDPGKICPQCAGKSVSPQDRKLVQDYFAGLGRASPLKEATANSH